MSDSDKFFEMLIDGVAEKIQKDVGFTRTIANKIQYDREIIESLVERVDPEELAKNLAIEIIRKSDTRGTSMAHGTLPAIMKRSTELATEMISKKMYEDAISA